ncbi:MAG: amino acid ABC transporter permease [Hyphomicrobiales bacterium]|nr:MAG: amino acid ABC transporter permease [Hyphomicrobiales bacterium]
MAVDTAGRLAPQKTAFYNDPVIRGFLYQGLVILLVVAAGYWLVTNAITNLRAQGKTFGFDFLGNTAGFDIAFKLIPYDRTSTYLDVFKVGLLNTLLVSVIGIIISTVLGFVLGIARLSRNWLVANIAAVYVEVTRNIPPLLQLFIWYFAVLKVMPPVKQSFNFGDMFFLNGRGFYGPVPIFDDKFVWTAVAFVVSIVAAVLLRRWAKLRLERTGQRFPVFLTALAIIVGLTTAVFLLSGTQVTFNLPALAGFNFRGGFAAPPELTALVVGLSIYHATFIGENVRAGIQAVSHGQTEAAQSLGLKDNDRLRLVIIPQAMRVIIPPTTSEYLSLAKNSSLGAAIAFPELVSIFSGTALNQAGRAIEIVGMTMAVYLTFSLLTSFLMNIYNARVALVER